MGYEKSEYNRILEEALLSNKTEEEVEEILTYQLEEELSNPEKYGDWLAWHYNGSAESFVEYAHCASKEEYDPELAERMRKCSEEEIRLFSKYGYETIANWWRKFLSEANATLKERGFTS